MHPNKIGPIRSVSAPRRARPPQLPSFFHGLSLLLFSLSDALLLFNEEVKTPQNKGEYRNPN
jgi:hypothetical protein